MEFPILPLIINEHASRAETFLADFSSTRFPTVRLFRVQNDAGLRQALEEAKPLSDTIIVGGGDGTLASAAGFLANAGKTLGILPLGTTNNFARSLGYFEQTPESLLEAYTLAVPETDIKEIDIASMDGKSFLNLASLGLSGEIARSVDFQEKRFWGRAAYLRGAWRVLRHTRPFQATYQASECEYTYQVFQVLIFNGTHHVGMQIKESAFLQAGRLSLVFFTSQTPLQYVWHFFLFLLGRPPAWIKQVSASTFRLTLSREVPLELDGEPAPFRSGTFAVKPGGLKVLCLSQKL